MSLTQSHCTVSLVECILNKFSEKKDRSAIGHISSIWTRKKKCTKSRLLKRQGNQKIDFRVARKDQRQDKYLIWLQSKNHLNCCLYLKRLCRKETCFQSDRDRIHSYSKKTETYERNRIIIWMPNFKQTNPGEALALMVDYDLTKDAYLNFNKGLNIADVIFTLHINLFRQ